MNCPSCDRENREDSRFCLGCGSALALSCPGCARELPGDAVFCDGCGHRLDGGIAAPRARDPRTYTPKHLADKILRSKSAIEGERKQVTVLFADVKGSMELAEQLDPEEWHGILDRFFQILSEGVHRFEGTVNQYTGDGIMALFGAPIAHEDHPQRACYAALALRDEIARYTTEVKRAHGIGLLTRMGIHSGEVVVGKIGDDLRMDYTAQGHSVGLAQRMEALAAPGTAYLSEATADRVTGYFDLGDLGEFRIKGVRDPVRVFDLRGLGSARTRFDVSRARGLTRFVGRDDDLATLQTALEQSRAGNGQVVGVVAEAGTGKSRLCFEFIEGCRADGIDVYEGHAVAHGKNIPYLPMLELFRSYFRIAEDDAPRVARDRIAGRLLLLEETFREVLPVVFDFMGVPDPANPAPPIDPEGRQRLLYGVVRRVMQGDRDNLSISVVEDLHWMDAASEAFLEQLVEAVEGTRALLLVNFRPEFHAAWMQKTSYRQLPLAPLGPDAIRELLEHLLGADASIIDLAETIHARSGGNPFFTEEAVQSLIESGHLEGVRGAYRLVTAVEGLSIPDSVQSILAARIDKQAEREKYVLQAAAVIGKEFPETILAQVVDLTADELAAALAALRSSEFVFQQSLYPAIEYAFKHPLTQEVALESQLAERRRGLHARVARAIEEAHPERMEEQAGLLAHHWEEAGEALLAARWHGRAAVWVGASDPAEALRHWRRVRALVETTPESAETLALAATACVQTLQFSWRLGCSEEEAASVFDEGRALAERSGEPAPLAMLLAAYGAVRGLAGDVLDYIRYGKEATEVADRTSDPGLRCAVGIPLMVSHDRAGRLREALEFSEQTIARGGEDSGRGAEVFGFSPYVFAVWFRGRLLAEMGRHDEARRSLERAEELSRQHGEAENLAWTLGNGYLTLALHTGEREAAVARAREAVETAEKIGSNFSRTLAYGALSEALILDAEYGEAAAAAERSLQIARDKRTGLMDEAAQLISLAAAHLGRGETDRGVEVAEEAAAVAHRRSTRVYEARALVTLARGLLEDGRSESRGRAEGALARALTLIDETGNEALRPFVHLERSKRARLDGSDESRERELREAHRLFAEMGASGNAERLARELRVRSRAAVPPRLPRATSPGRE